jgi:hypothetical protein
MEIVDSKVKPFIDLIYFAVTLDSSIMGIPYTLNECETAPSHIRDSMWSVQIWI